MKKPTLGGMQKKFWRGLLGADDVSLFTKGAQRGLRVYQDAYFLRIYDSLRADYPTAANELGEKKFRSLIKDYLKKHPSEHFSLRYMGQKFPTFFAKHALGKAKPWLVEATHYDWLKLDLYDVSDHPIVKQTDLTQIPPEKWADLKMIFISHLHLLSLNYAVEDEGKPKTPATIKTLAVWRKKEDVYHRRIATLELKMMKLLRRGKSFGDTCEVLAKSFKTPEAAASFSFQTLSRWLFDEIIEKIT